MKRYLKTICIVALLTAAPLFMLAQTPPHPNNGGAAPGAGNHPVGGSAPVGNGTLILLTLAAAYAGRKVYEIKSDAIAE